MFEASPSSLSMPSPETAALTPEQRAIVEANMLNLDHSLTGLLSAVQNDLKHDVSLENVRPVDADITPGETSPYHSAIARIRDLCEIVVQGQVAGMKPERQAKLPDNEKTLLGVQAVKRHLAGTDKKDFSATVDDLTMLAYFAGTTKPQPGVTTDSLQQKIFTIATSTINKTKHAAVHDIMSDPVTSRYMKGFDDKNRELVVSRMKLAGDEVAYQRFREISLVNQAAQYLYRLLHDPEFTAEAFKQELYVLEMSQRTSDDEASIELSGETYELPVEETNWTILPPEDTGLHRDPTIRTNTHEAQEDEARLRWLAELAIDWGNGAYLAVGTLRGSGKRGYTVAVLPQTLTDGTIIEHAVAENPNPGNGRYIFRAERGRQRGGITWREAFRDHRRRAEELGAKALRHVHRIEENTLEYLTRPAEFLDDDDRRHRR